MDTWFDCKVVYEKTLENGLIKKISESYLVKAFNIVEVEKKIVEELKPFIRGDFEVTDVRKAKIAELYYENTYEDAIWYKLKLVFITIDESKGKEKKNNTFVIIKANSIKQVLGILEDKMRGSVIDFTIASVTETTYSDVIF